MRKFPNSRYGPRTVFCGRKMPSVFQAAKWFEQACKVLGVLPGHITKACRRHHIVEKRWLVAYALRMKNCRLDDIADLLERDRATVIHGLHMIERRLKSSEADGWAKQLERLNEEGA